MTNESFYFQEIVLGRGSDIFLFYRLCRFEVEIFAAFK